MTAVTGFDDRNMINQCLLYRYILSYEPFNFKGRLTDFPQTVAYGQLMDALRVELREWFWDGTFTDTIGATVLADGAPHHPYAVFRHSSSNRSGLVVANYEPDDDQVIEVRLHDHDGPLRYRLVDETAWHPTDGTLTIPPRSAAVILPTD